MLVAPVGKHSTYVLGSGCISRDLLDGVDTKRPELTNGSCSRVFVRDPAADELEVHGIRRVGENRDSHGHTAVSKISGFEHPGASGVLRHNNDVGGFDGSRHVHSERARLWFEQASEQQFSFCRFTQLTVLRLLTTQQIMGKDTKTMSEAWSLWDRIWADSRIVFLPEPDGLEKEFRSRSRLSSPSPKVWADAYLLAFTSVSGLKLVTFDRALKARDADVLVL